VNEPNSNPRSLNVTTSYHPETGTDCKLISRKLNSFIARGDSPPIVGGHALCSIAGASYKPRAPHGTKANKLELELIQTQMAQKSMLRAEVYAHAMRASQNRKKEVRREKKV